MPEFEPTTETADQQKPIGGTTDHHPVNTNAAAGNAAVQRMIVATHTTGLNLRSAAAIEDNVVGSLARGAIVETSGAPQNGFTHVNNAASGRRGWASLQWLRPEHGAFAKPPLTKPAPKVDHGVIAPLMQPLPPAAKDATRVAITPRLLSAAVHPAALPKDTHKHETIAGEAFVKGAGDAHDIDPNDVAQGALGDCYFLSSLAAVARANPELIRKLIKKIDAHTYEVTLFAKDHFWSSRTPHKILVTDQFPVDGNNPAYAQKGDVGPQGPELWVMLFEKAFATMEGSYKAIESGYGSTGLNLILAGGGTDYNTSGYSADALAKVLDDALRSHKPVCTSTGVSNGAAWLDGLKAKHPWLPEWFVSQEMKRTREVGGFSSHEYSVAGVDLKARKIKIQNPWGSHHLELSFEDYKAVFSDFSIGKV